MHVRDLTGREPGYSVTVEVGATYEFLISLAAFGLPAEQETYEVGPGWFDKIRTAASSRLLEVARQLGPEVGHVWVNLIGLATVPPAARDVSAFLARARALSAVDLRRYLLGCHVPAYRQSISAELLEQAARGDPVAQADLAADPAFFGSKHDVDLRPFLALTPDRTRELALELMERWYQEVFASMEADVLPVLERDAAAKRSLLETRSPVEVIELAGGVEFVAQPGIRHVYLIPQITTRPWVWLAEHDEARLYCYPVADESLAGPGEAEPPGRLVRLHRALGDEKRLRMLRALATSSATLQELADRFGLPKSTAHHHLAILRSAGLIRVTSDQEHRYTIRAEAIPEVQSLLEGFLGPVHR